VQFQRNTWAKFKKTLQIKFKRGVIGNFTLSFEDTINNCVLHEYEAPLRPWEQWELKIVYEIFRLECKEMLE
jgi:hypothetical protein